MPNGLSAAVTSGPPFNNITAGYTTGRVSNNNPIASINIPKITYPRSINKSVTYGSKGSDIIQLAKSSGSPEKPKNLTKIKTPHIIENIIATNLAVSISAAFRAVILTLL